MPSDSRPHSLAGCRRRHGDVGPAAGRPCTPDCGCHCHERGVTAEQRRRLGLHANYLARQGRLSLAGALRQLLDQTDGEP